MKYDYYIVDVFTERKFEGNSLAVFPCADGLTTDQMQRIAREMNLSETTFTFRPERDGVPRVRIFTPAYEMAFAGHPTIGTAAVLMRLGIVTRNTTNFELHENVGNVPLRVEEGANTTLWLTTPPIRDEGEMNREACAAALSLKPANLADVPCQILNAGNPNVFVTLGSRETVDQVKIVVSAYEELMRDRSMPTCIFAFAPVDHGAYSRMFAPALGILEDPATGSATGPLAAFMMRHGMVSKRDGTRFVSVQGQKMGRRSELHVAIHGEGGIDGIEVGGTVTFVAEGELEP